MGWKAFRDAYKITHIVCVTDKGVCIGSPYVHNLVEIDPKSGRIKENETFGRFLEQNYPELAAAGHEEIVALLQAEDVFTSSIPVFTYKGAEIIEKLCEAPAWPNVTHDGDLMHDNQYHTNRDQVIAWAKRNAELEEKHLHNAIERVQDQLSDLQARLTKSQANQERLAADHPTVLAAPYLPTGSTNHE